jgi:hypothetical protein
MSGIRLEGKSRAGSCDGGVIGHPHRCGDLRERAGREHSGSFWCISDLTVSYGEVIARSSVSIDITRFGGAV